MPRAAARGAPRIWILPARTPIERTSNAARRKMGASDGTTDQDGGRLKPMAEASTVPNRGPITVSIMLATLMNTLDSTIANVALPHIQGSLSASPDQITWVLTSYIVAVAVMTPMSGWLAGRFGMKRTFLVIITGFTLTSMLCGLATSLPQIVIFRFLQGLFGASTIPLSQAMLLNINPPERHPQAMAIWAMGTILGPILGPVNGGFLTDEYSWRWCFYINLPIGIIAMLGIWTFMPARGGDSGRKFDFLGFSALAVAVATLQLMLDRGPGQDWFNSPEICGEALLSAMGLWVFVAHSLTARRAFFNPRLFQDRNLVAATSFGFFTGIMVFSSLAILPLLMQSLLGYPALTAGSISVSRGVGMILVMPVIGRLTRMFDNRLLLLAGLGLTALAMWQMSHFDLSMGVRPLVVSGFIQGAGTGLFLVPLTTSAFATIGNALRPEATSIFNLVRNFGASIGISITQALAVYNTQVMHASLAARVIPSDETVRAGLTGAFDPDTASGLLALNGELTRQATMVAYVDDFRLLLVLTLACSPLVILLRQAKTRDISSALADAAD
jgi:DHA2 family multidrug resistance protein